MASLSGLTVSQYDLNKYITVNFTGSATGNEYSSVTTVKKDKVYNLQIWFNIINTNDTGEAVRWAVMPVWSSITTDNSNNVVSVKFPIPNQLLNGTCCGEILFNLYKLTSSDEQYLFGQISNIVEESSHALKINKATKSSTYDSNYTPTPIKNDYNAYIGNSEFIESLVNAPSRKILGTIKTIDTKKIDTSANTRLGSMFEYCISLTSLDLSSFNTSNVFEMYKMFYYCKSLTSLDLRSFDTSEVTTMNSMFYYCTSLTSLDLSSFNTSKVTAMNSMFYYCTSLTTLDLSSFDTSKVRSMYNMFWFCRNLKTLVLGDNWASSVDMLDFRYTSLTLDSYLDMFNKLATRTNSPRLIIPYSATNSLLSPSEIAIATNKGWTVANQ